MAETTTSRFLLRRWSSDNDTFSRTEWDGNMGQIETLGATYSQSTLAGRPAANSASKGMLAWTTDAGTESLYYGDGAVWQVIRRKATLTARAHKAADQSGLSSTVFTQIALDTVSATGAIETFGGITLASNRLVVPRPGLYLITANVTFNHNGSSTVADRAAITKNGTHIADGSASYITSEFGTVELSIVTQLLANDAIGLNAMPTGNNTVTVKGGTLYTSLTVTLLNG